MNRYLLLILDKLGAIRAGLMDRLVSGPVGLDAETHPQWQPERLALLIAVLGERVGAIEAHLTSAAFMRELPPSAEEGIRELADNVAGLADSIERSQDLGDILATADEVARIIDSLMSVMASGVGGGAPWAHVVEGPPPEAEPPEAEPPEAEPPEAEPPARQRRIQAHALLGAEPPAGARPARALRAGEAHIIEVRIGAHDAVWAELAEHFPDEMLPPGRDAYRLTVVLVEPRLAPTPQVTTITLPAAGDSTVARFPIHARGDVTEMAARVTVLHENRVLQTAMLRAAVVADPENAPEAGAFRVEPETFTSLDLRDLGGRVPFDLALVLNHAEGQPQVTGIAGEDVCLVNLHDIDTWTGSISDDLSAVAYGSEDYADLDADRVSRLFNTLASRGSLFFEAIFDHASEPLREALLAARRVQIVAAQPGGLLPLELAYVHRAPKDNARLCPHTAEVLGARACTAASPGGKNKDEALHASPCSTACPAGEKKDDVVCPLGFWGLSRVIERQSDGLLPLGADFGLRVNAGPRRRLDVLRSALFAASAKVDTHAEGSSTAVTDALAAATGGHVATVTDWGNWVDGIKNAPSLLVLMVHTEKKDGMLALEIGAGNFLRLSLIYEEYVDPTKTAVPVVLLIGCRTAISDIEFQKFPVKFQRYGAALVLGTIATVLGRHAGPVTARLVTTLAELTEKGDVPFGDALLATKQKLVAEGQIMAMCLCAHGDAGWILGKAREAAR